MTKASEKNLRLIEVVACIRTSCRLYIKKRECAYQVYFKILLVMRMREGGDMTCPHQIKLMASEVTAMRQPR